MYRTLHRVLGILSRSYSSDGTCHRHAHMAAWQIREYGGVEKLEWTTHIKKPHMTTPDDVLVEVHAASINPIDLKMLAGYGSHTLPVVQRLTSMNWSRREFPKTLGVDFSGLVVDVGKKAQKHFKPGDQVWGVVSPVLTSQGSHASYVVTPSHCLSLKPSSLSHVEAASVPYVLCTTVSAVTTCISSRSLRGKRVLLVGASGGIGTFATQMFTHWGAGVTAVCAGDAADLVMSLGATTVVDYRTQDVLDTLKHGEPFDLILDSISLDDRSLDNWMDLLYPWKQAYYIRLMTPLLRNNDKFGLLSGTVLSATDVVSKSLKYSTTDGKNYRWAFFTPRPEELRSCAKDFDKDLLRPVIDSVFPFSSVPEAFERLKAGHTRGKVVIKVM